MLQSVALPLLTASGTARAAHCRGWPPAALFKRDRFELPETGLERLSTGFFGDQDAAGSHKRIDDIADPENELLHPTGDARVNDRLIQFDLRLFQRRFGGCLLGG